MRRSARPSKALICLTHTQHLSLFTPMSQVSFQPPSDARQRFERNTCRRSCSLLCLGLWGCDGYITIATSKKCRKAKFIGFVTVFVLVCSGFDLNFIAFWRLLNIVMPVMFVDFHRISCIGLYRGNISMNSMEFLC